MRRIKQIDVFQTQWVMRRGAFLGGGVFSVLCQSLILSRLIPPRGQIPECPSLLFANCKCGERTTEFSRTLTGEVEMTLGGVALSPCTFQYLLEQYGIQKE